MTLRSLNSFGWLTSLIGVAGSLIGVAMIASSTGCDASYVPPGSEGTGGAAGPANPGPDPVNPGSGGSTNASGGSNVGTAGDTAAAGTANSSGGTGANPGTGGTGADPGAAGTTSGGSGGSGPAGGPTTLYCPPGRNLSLYIDFANPEWTKDVFFTFGNGELTGWENDGDTDDNIAVVDDPEKGKALQVVYRGGSGPNSCFTCVADGATAPDCVCRTSGGVEFYADFAKGRVLEYAFLSYWVRFGDAGSPFDWGGGAERLARHEAGKMPGFSGGIPVHGLNVVNGSGFTARGMWRDNVCGSNTSELYWYGLPVGSRNTDQCGDGPSWSWQNDAQWHHVQMQINMSTGANYDGSVQMWYDKPITETPNIDVQELGMLNRNQFPTNSVNQLMFSTFFGGHDNTWGPLTDVHAYFADVQICD